MPSTLHDGWAHLFRDQPRVVVDLLRATASAELPVDVSVAPHSNDLGSSRAVELRADGVFRIQHRGVDLLGVLSEIQLAIDPDKVFSWPGYVTSLRAALRCGVVLLVFTNDPAVAEGRGCEDEARVRAVRGKPPASSVGRVLRSTAHSRESSQYRVSRRPSL